MDIFLFQKEQQEEFSGLPFLNHKTTEKMKAAEAAFRANKAYYDAGAALKGKVDIKNVDFDSYGYFVLEEVPTSIVFPSETKRLQSPKLRIKEFRNYLCFVIPDNLDMGEAKRAKGIGLKAATEYLNSVGVKCHVRWRFRD